MGKIIGIDLGTTNSVVAIADDVQPRVLDNREGKSQTPSVVGVKRRKGKTGENTTEMLVGEAAVDNWVMAALDTIFAIKRLMGRGVADDEVQRLQRRVQYKVVQPSDGTRDSVRVVLGGKECSPVEVSAMILRKLKDDAEFRLGDEVTHVVITVPAYFSQVQREATRRAGTLAGLRVIKILDEPTAAAIAFGVQPSPQGEPKYVLVYDLGGGTFDVSVLMCDGQVFAPLDLEGDMWLGGEDFDQLLVDHALRYVRSEYGLDPTSNTRFLAALRKAARAIKERLSSAGSADLVVPALLQSRDGDLIDLEMEITRDEFERMIRPLVDRSVEIVEKALANAGLTCEQVHHVIMAGNATCVPLVQQAIEKLFGAGKILRHSHPKHSVALGAAMVAVSIGERIVCENCGYENPSDVSQCSKCKHVVSGTGGTETEEPTDNGSPAVETKVTPVGIAPYHYGIRAAEDEFKVFINKNDPVPTPEPQVITFYTEIPNQRLASIPVYGGDHLGHASANELQGQALAVLPRGLPEKSPLRRMPFT